MLTRLPAATGAAAPGEVSGDLLRRMRSGPAAQGQAPDCRSGPVLGTRTARVPDCRPLLADPDDLTLAFQPIVDLAGATIAGYEALVRFPGSAGPDVWFATAAEAGIAAELEALAVHKALAAVDHLPADTFRVLGPPAARRAAPPGGQTRPRPGERRGHRPRARGAGRTAPVSLRVHPTTDVIEALQRALTRAPAVRFDPVLCTDRTGHVLGLLRIEDLASASRKGR